MKSSKPRRRVKASQSGTIPLSIGLIKKAESLLSSAILPSSADEEIKLGEYVADLSRDDDHLKIFLLIKRGWLLFDTEHHSGTAHVLNKLVRRFQALGMEFIIDESPKSDTWRYGIRCLNRTVLVNPLQQLGGDEDEGI